MNPKFNQFFLSARYIYGINFIMIRLLVTEISCGQTDGQTDKQTNKQTNGRENITSSAEVNIKDNEFF